MDQTGRNTTSVTDHSRVILPRPPLRGEAHLSSLEKESVRVAALQSVSTSCVLGRFPRSRVAIPEGPKKEDRAMAAFRLYARVAFLVAIAVGASVSSSLADDVKDEF